MASGLIGVDNVVFGLYEAEETPGELGLVVGTERGEAEAVFLCGRRGGGGGFSGADGEGAVPGGGRVRAFGRWRWLADGVWGWEDGHFERLGDEKKKSRNRKNMNSSNVAE